MIFLEGRKMMLSEEGKKEFIRLYEEGINLATIAKEMGFSRDVATRFKKELGLVDRRRKYPFCEDYFSTIDTEEKAYWLGFIAADGYIHEGRYTLQFELQESDREQVEKFAKAIQTKRPILTIKCGKDKQFTHYRLVINSKRMVSDLQRYGVVQNKSLTFKPVNIPEDFIKYWIIGYMDGDGCVFDAKGKPKISFTGTKETIAFIKEFFNSSNAIRKEHRCESTYQIRLENDISRDFLLEVDYLNLSYPLRRKQEKFASLCGNT